MKFSFFANVIIGGFDQSRADQPELVSEIILEVDHGVYIWGAPCSTFNSPRTLLGIKQYIFINNF